MSNSLQNSRSAHLLRAIAIRGYIALVLIPFAPASATVGSEGEEIALRPTTLRMIFTDSVFEGIHRADALAAITVWAERIGVGRGFELTAETNAYDRVQDVYKRIVAGTADFIIMDAFHYFELADQGAPIKPMFVPDRGDYVMEEYFLLTKRGQAPDTLAELRGHSIALVKMAGANMAQTWTDLLLAKEGHPTIFEFFSGTRIVGKPSAALLPVYFGQLDACVIDRSGFELTVELNPQIGKSLEIFRQSPPFLETVLCLHDDYVEVRQDLIEALQEMHTTPTGQQLLLVFKIDQLLDFEPRYLDSIRALRRATRVYRRENQPATPPFLSEGLRDPNNSDKLTITRTDILHEASLRSENENR